MRGEGNHKIPGSFAPENMEKTGAERVKYSLACQHEDAISIKFVSYAQKCSTVLCTFAVALRKESVDRNADGVVSGSGDYVALRKESVDRNNDTTRKKKINSASLSARRAWIEICRYIGSNVPNFAVALRKESVDRNTYIIWEVIKMLLSLSARRAWIEIRYFHRWCPCYSRRSPQGERG